MDATAICPNCNTEIEYESSVSIDMVVSRHRFSCTGTDNKSKDWISFTKITKWESD